MIRSHLHSLLIAGTLALLSTPASQAQVDLTKGRQGPPQERTSKPPKLDAPVSEPRSNAPGSRVGDPADLRGSGRTGTVDPRTLEPWVRWWSRNRPAYLVTVNELQRDAPDFLVDEGNRRKSLARQREEVLATLDLALESDHRADRIAALLARSLVAEAADPHLAELVRRADEDSSQAMRAAAWLAAVQAPASPARHDLWSRFAGAPNPRRTETLSERQRSQSWTAVLLGLIGTAPPISLLQVAVEDRELSEGMRALWLTAAGLGGNERHLPLLLRIAGDRSASTVLRCAATEALGRLGGEEVLPELVRLLHDPGSSPDLRAGAASAISQLAGPADREALHALERTASRDGHVWVRSFALLGLGQVGGPVAEAVLIQALSGGKSTERPYAALGLGLLARSGSRAATGALVQQFERTRSPLQLEALVAALALSRDPNAFPSLEKALGSRNAELRAATAEALSVHGHPASLALLEEVSRDDSSSAVRAAAAEAYGSLDPLATLVLQRRLVDGSCPNAQSRIPILDALGSSRDPQAIPVLLAEWKRSGVGGSERAASLRALGRLYRTQRWDFLDALGFGSNLLREPPDLARILEIDDPQGLLR